jgi:DNA-directed RNA polymerase subunit M/transcription elongation factor TFIIS
MSNIYNFCTSMEDELYTSASTIKELSYITDYKIDESSKKVLNSSVDRNKNIILLSSLIIDIDIAITLEAGIFEYALVYGLINGMSETIIQSIYNDKFNELVSYIDKKSSKYNKYVYLNIIKKKVNSQEVAFQSPQEINPEGWKNIIKKRELREYKKNNMAATDLYKCYTCQERRCQVRQLQTRGADEPITNFVTCLNCFKTFKV